MVYVGHPQQTLDHRSKEDFVRKLFSVPGLIEPALVRHTLAVNRVRFIALDVHNARTFSVPLCRRAVFFFR